VCAEKIKPGVAVCRACGAILDKEKAAQYGIVPKRARRERPDASAADAPVADSSAQTDGAGKSGLESDKV
jgi:hypothetical protein